MNLININNTSNQVPVQKATGNSVNGDTEIEEQEAINLNQDRIANLRNSITQEPAQDGSSYDQTWLYGSNQEINTGDANNTIYVHASDSSINTEGAGDIICTYPETDSNTINAGDGDDSLSIYGKNHSAYGGDGNDSIFLHCDPDSENIFVDSGAGDDLIVVGGRDHEIESGAGNDSICFFGDTTKVSTGEGDDGALIAAGYGNELNTGSGNDSVNMSDNAHGNIIETDDGDDLVAVSGTENQIDTGEGNDYVLVGVGAVSENNVINTGNGEDVVDVFSGNDTINTGDGNDIVALRVNDGSTVNTGNGDDIVTVSKEASGQINGGEGEDTVLLQGKESDYTLETSEDGRTKTYTRNDGSKIVLTDVEKVIITEDTPHLTGELPENLIPKDNGSGSGTGDGHDPINRDDPFESRRVSYQEILASLEQELEAALNSEDEGQKNSIDSLKRQISITTFMINMYDNLQNSR